MAAKSKSRTELAAKKENEPIQVVRPQYSIVDAKKIAKLLKASDLGKRLDAILTIRDDHAYISSGICLLPLLECLVLKSKLKEIVCAAINVFCNYLLSDKDAGLFILTKANEKPESFKLAEYLSDLFLCDDAEISFGALCMLRALADASDAVDCSSSNGSAICSLLVSSESLITNLAQYILKLELVKNIENEDISIYISALSILRTLFSLGGTDSVLRIACMPEFPNTLCQFVKIGAQISQKFCLEQPKKVQKLNKSKENSKVNSNTDRTVNSKSEPNLSLNQGFKLIEQSLLISEILVKVERSVLNSDDFRTFVDVVPNELCNSIGGVLKSVYVPVVLSLCKTEPDSFKSEKNKEVGLQENPALSCTQLLVNISICSRIIHCIVKTYDISTSVLETAINSVCSVLQLADILANCWEISTTLKDAILVIFSIGSMGENHRLSICREGAVPAILEIMTICSSEHADHYHDLVKVADFCLFQLIFSSEKSASDIFGLEFAFSKLDQILIQVSKEDSSVNARNRLIRLYAHLTSIYRHLVISAFTIESMSILISILSSWLDQNPASFFEFEQKPCEKKSENLSNKINNSKLKSKLDPTSEISAKSCKKILVQENLMDDVTNVRPDDILNCLLILIRDILCGNPEYCKLRLNRDQFETFARIVASAPLKAHDFLNFSSKKAEETESKSICEDSVNTDGVKTDIIQDQMDNREKMSWRNVACIRCAADRSMQLINPFIEGEVSSSNPIDCVLKLQALNAEISSGSIPMVRNIIPRALALDILKSVVEKLEKSDESVNILVNYTVPMCLDLLSVDVDMSDDRVLVGIAVENNRELVSDDVKLACLRFILALLRKDSTNRHDLLRIAHGNNGNWTFPHLSDNQVLELKNLKKEPWVQPLSFEIWNLQDYKTKFDLKALPYVRVLSTILPTLAKPNACNCHIKVALEILDELTKEDWSSNLENCSCDIFSSTALELGALPSLVSLAAGTYASLYNDAYPPSLLMEESNKLFKRLTQRGTRYIEYFSSQVGSAPTKNNDSQKPNVSKKAKNNRNMEEKDAEKVIPKTRPNQEIWGKLLNISGFEYRALKGEFSISPLLLSAMLGFEDGIIELLQNGACSNSIGPENKTPLMYALALGLDEGVRALLKANANVEAWDINGNSILKYAFMSSKTRLNHQYLMDKISMERVIYGNGRFVDDILVLGADPNVPDDNGQCPIHWISGNKTICCIKLEMFSLSISVFPEEEGHTFGLDIQDPAISASHKVLFQQLLSHGAQKSLSAADMNGMTPLHLSLSCGNTIMTQVLIDAGSKINVLDKKGQLPLHLAAGLSDSSEAMHLFSLLLESGIGDIIVPVSVRSLQHRRGLNKQQNYYLDIEEMLKSTFNQAIQPEALKSIRVDRKELINFETNIGWTPLNYCANADSSTDIENAKKYALLKSLVADSDVVCSLSSDDRKKAIFDEVYCSRIKDILLGTNASCF